MENVKISQVAEIELVYRTNVTLSSRPEVTCVEEAYDLLLSTWDPGKLGFIEQFKVLLLNQAGRVLGIFELSSGGVAGTIIDVKLIFVAALKANASGIIISHNHPSGSLIPSNADIINTRQIVAAGKLLDLPVFDHLILTTEGYISMAERGYM